MFFLIFYKTYYNILIISLFCFQSFGLSVFDLSKTAQVIVRLAKEMLVFTFTH